MTKAVTDPGFSQGAQLSEGDGIRDTLNFPKRCMKLRKFWSQWREGGGFYTPVVPPTVAPSARPPSHEFFLDFMQFSGTFN